MPAEFSSRAALEVHQLAQLRALLAALVPANAFHSEKIAAAGLGTEPASLGEFTARMPFTTKAELIADQLAHPPFGTNLTFPLACYTRFNQTSGTSGEPLRWLDTPENWDWMLDNWRIVFRAAGAPPGTRVFFAFSFGPFLGFWTAYEAAARAGLFCIPGGGLGSEARLRMIFENRATILCCTPTYALRLGETARATGLEMRDSPVRTIIVAGEPGGSIPAVRAQIKQLWPGARVFDHHGMTEVGPVTFECPEKPGTLAVIESSYFAEIVEPASGRAVAEGEVGELVLTTLGRTGSPLLRYRTGDLVRGIFVTTFSQPAPLLGLEGGILGRVDDMVIVRGVNIYPGALEQIIRKQTGVAEFQVEVRDENSMAELRVLVEPREDCADTTALARTLETELKAALALRIPVRPVAPGTLPRFEMKSKRWVRLP